MKKRSDISTFRVLEAFAVTWVERKRCLSAEASLAIATPGQRLQRDFPSFSEKLIWRAMEREESRGYIEYGVSLNAGWLTNKGIAKLVELTPSNPL